MPHRGPDRNFPDEPHWGEEEIALIRWLVEGHPRWHRQRISQELARLWERRNSCGQLKDMATRTLLIEIDRSGRRLCAHWQAKYGCQFHLIETLVDTSRLTGACCRAANWRLVGTTTGRTRQNKTRIPRAPPTAVWLRPLSKNDQVALCAS